MGEIKLDYVISYSSQDKYCKAENLLLNTGKPWLCAPDDRTGRLVAEFQLSRASKIDFIDIGNHGSTSIEIQVGRSNFLSKTEYVSFLPTMSLLSFADLKENAKQKTVVMLNKSNFNEAAASEEWDRIKVICCQPFKKNSQFGLSFLSLRTGTKDTKTEFSIYDPSSLVIKNDRSPLKYSQENLPNFKLTRGKQLLNASISKITQNGGKPHSPKFEEDVAAFLIVSLGEDETPCLEDFLKEFELQSQQTLDASEKRIFRLKYLDLISNGLVSQCQRRDPFLMKQENGENSPLKTDFVKSEVPSFDLELSTPTRRKLSDSDEADDMKRAIKRLKRPTKHSKVSEILNVSPEDFIQSDGVQPSTSSGVTYVDCPICREYFPSEEIERHASTCGDLTADVEYLYSNKSNAVPSNDIEDSFITCLFCEELYPEGLVNSHMDACVSK